MVPACAVRSWMSSDIVSAVRSEGRAAHLGPCTLVARAVLSFMVVLY